MGAAHYVMAIDQDATGNRAILFEHAAKIASTGQLEQTQLSLASKGGVDRRGQGGGGYRD